MKILIVHNYYQQDGGEDTIFHNEVNLLRDNGHQIIVHTVHNNQINKQSKLRTALETVWSFTSYKEISRILRQESPDIAYFFNTFPLISPSAYYACKKGNVPVIQVLANPRYMCPAATLYRSGKLCLDCVGKNIPWPGIIHRCYHDSILHTSVVAFMLYFHKLIRTWEKVIDRYFVATNFYIRLYEQAGLPADKLEYKTHFIPNELKPSKETGTYALFIGRLEPVKGIETLLDAWKDLDIPLKIRGSGQLEDAVTNFICNHNLRNVELVGRLSFEELFLLMKNARFLVWPSEGYYETFGMVTVECFSLGVPALASDLGVIQEIVDDGKTGILFEAGNAKDLALKALWMWDNPELVQALGKNARLEYEQKYTPEKNYQQLMEIYERVLNRT